jgi:CBS domain-containing protein
MYARDIMNSPVFVVTPDENIAHARHLMMKHRISRVLVMENGMLSGILTKKDIAYRLRQKGAAWRHRPLDQILVSTLAVPYPVVVSPDTGIREIAKIFVAKNISSVPVVDGCVVVGIVTKTDLMKSALIATLGGMVQDVMEDMAAVNRHHSLDHVINMMSGRNDKLVVMENDGTIAGIITETNLAFYEDEQKISGVVEKDVAIRRRETAKGTSGQGALAVASVTAEDVMTSPVITITPASPLSDAIALMGRMHINSLVVTGNGTISGIIKRDDIIKEVAK